MPNQQIREIIAFSLKRYHENREIDTGLANAYMTIMNRAIDMQLGAGSISAIVHFLNRSRTDRDMTKACKDVLWHLGTIG
jgi:hypothetical protein